MNKLRLLVTQACPRNCAGCCNNEPTMAATIQELPVYSPEEQYREVMITGGEPLLVHDLNHVCAQMRAEQPRAKLFMYTAGVPGKPEITYGILFYLDGMCYTLHTNKDVEDFKVLLELMAMVPEPQHFKTLSLRLNVFEGVDIEGLDLSSWTVKDNMQWIKDCPLPEGEVFRKHVGLLDE